MTAKKTAAKKTPATRRGVATRSNVARKAADPAGVTQDGGIGGVQTDDGGRPVTDDGGRPVNQGDRDA